METHHESDNTQDWGGYVPRPAGVDTLTMDNIPAIKGKHHAGEVSKRVVQFWAALLAAAAIWAGAEAGARANFGCHAHEVLVDLVRLRMAGLSDSGAQDDIAALLVNETPAKK